jgi:hypothetical protein
MPAVTGTFASYNLAEPAPGSANYQAQLVFTATRLRHSNSVPFKRETRTINFVSLNAFPIATSYAEWSGCVGQGIYWQWQDALLPCAHSAHAVLDPATRQQEGWDTRTGDRTHQGIGTADPGSVGTAAAAVPPLGECMLWGTDAGVQ